MRHRKCAVDGYREETGEGSVSFSFDSSHAASRPFFPLTLGPRTKASRCGAAAAKACGELNATACPKT